MEMLYEYHSNQSGDPNNVLMHSLGHWRLTKHFHDLVFLPQVVVRLTWRRHKLFLLFDHNVSTVKFTILVSLLSVKLYN